MLLLIGLETTTMLACANTMQDATAHAQALALAGPPALVYNGGELPPVVPPVVSPVKARPRPPPPGLPQRRGLSDSGANSPAQAALSAAVAAATGVSMPAGLPPRPRPELLKSASGEATTGVLVCDGAGVWSVGHGDDRLCCTCQVMARIGARRLWRLHE